MRASWLSLTFVVVSLAGCAVSQEDFPEEAASAYCKRADACDFLDGSREDCEGAVSGTLNTLIGAADLFGAEWDAGGAGRCVRKVRSATCDQLDDFDWDGNCELFAED